MSAARASAPCDHGTVEKRLYLWLFDCCKYGERAPGNLVIAERFGFRSANSAVRHLKFLESTGLIRIERRGNNRRIWVGELQRWTA